MSKLGKPLAHSVLVTLRGSTDLVGDCPYRHYYQLQAGFLRTFSAHIIFAFVAKLQAGLRFVDTQTPKHPITQIRKHSNTQTLEHSNTTTRKHSNTQRFLRENHCDLVAVLGARAHQDSGCAPRSRSLDHSNLKVQHVLACHGCQSLACHADLCGTLNAGRFVVRLSQ